MNFSMLERKAPDPTYSAVIVAFPLVIGVKVTEHAVGASAPRELAGRRAEDPWKGARAAGKIAYIP